MKEEKRPPDESPELLTKHEVAKILRVSSRTIERYASERKLRHIRYSASVIRFRRSDVMKFLERNTVKDNPFAA